MPKRNANILDYLKLFAEYVSCIEQSTITTWDEFGETREPPMHNSKPTRQLAALENALGLVLMPRNQKGSITFRAERPSGLTEDAEHYRPFITLTLAYLDLTRHVLNPDVPDTSHPLFVVGFPKYFSAGARRAAKMRMLAEKAEAVRQMTEEIKEANPLSPERFVEFLDMPTSALLGIKRRKPIAALGHTEAEPDEFDS